MKWLIGALFAALVSCQVLAQGPLQAFPPGMFAIKAARDPASASCSFPSLPGLAGRWNALNVTTSGGNITSATDLSGNAHNLTPTGTVALNSTGYNGHPAFNFLVANAGVLSASSVPMGNAGQGYAFFVGQMLTNTQAFGGAVVYGVGAGNDFNSAGSAALLTRSNTNNSIASNSSNLGNPPVFAISLATNYRIGIVYSGGTVTTYLNNVSQTTDTYAGTFTTGGSIVVGGRYSSGAPSTSGNLWEGPITEIVVGSGSLSGTDLNNLDTYFTCQWGT